MGFTSFEPAANGFHFANDFVNNFVVNPGNFRFQTQGRCGGMAYAALDYFNAGLPIPTHVGADFGDPMVPPDGSMLADYVFMRLMMSFFVGSATRFVSFTVASDDDVFRATDDGIPAIQSQIDAGRPVALGLVGASSLADLGGKNHQVVAHGYRGEAFFVYDNNQPDTEVTLSREGLGWRFDPDGTHWRGWFQQDYAPVQPPYRDLVLESGITCPQRVPLRGPFSCSFIARNVSQFPAHLSRYFLYVRGPAGEVLDDMLSGDDSGTLLAPGNLRRVSKSTQSFGTNPGRYTLSAGFISEQGAYETLPPEAGRPDAHGPVIVLGVDTTPPPPPLKTMLTAVDPYPVPTRRPVAILVTARDETTGEPIVGADVQIGPTHAGETGTQMPPRIFRTRIIRDPADPENTIEIGPLVTVHQPGYEPADVDCGW